MSSAEIDAYLESVPEPQRDVLSALRTLILKEVPLAEEGISYRIPAFFAEGAVVAGFASFSTHMSYFPFSGSVLSQLSEEIAAHSYTKSALHFTAASPLSEGLVRRLVAVRLKEISDRGR